MSTILTAVNSKGSFNFDTNGNLNTNTLNTYINSKNKLCFSTSNFSINNDISLKSNILDFNVKTIHFNNEIIDFNIEHFNINSKVLNIGSDENLTNSVNIQCMNDVNINSEDFNLVSSECINLISQSGEILLGSDINKPFIKFENNNILLNQSSSDYDRKLNISLDKSSNDKKDYNGILIETNEEINNEIEIINKKSSISLGNYSTNNKHAIINYFEGYKKGNKIYLINYNYLNQKNIYWINNSSYDKILNFNYEILDLKTNSDYNIKIDILQNTIKKYIITLENNNKLIINNIEYNFNNNIILDNISLYFEKLENYKINDRWEFRIGLTALSEYSNDLDYQKGCILNENLCYLKNDCDFEINKNIQICNNGIGINSSYPKPNEFKISNDFNKEYYLTDYLDVKQCNPNLYNFNNKVIYLWEEEIDNQKNIYFKLDNQITKINKNISINDKIDISTINDNHFIIIWTKSENIEDKNKIYEINYQIYKDNKPIKNIDILLTRLYNFKNTINPKVININNKHILIAFCGEYEIIYKLNIYGIIIDINGNIVVDKFQINDNNDYSYEYPVLFKNSNSYGCYYHYKKENKYYIKYKLLNDKSENYDLYYENNDEKYLLEVNKPIKSIDNHIFCSMKINNLINKNEIVLFKNNFYLVKSINKNILELELTTFHKNYKTISLKLIEKNNTILKCVLEDKEYICKIDYNINSDKLLFNAINIIQLYSDYQYCNPYLVRLEHEHLMIMYNKKEERIYMKDIQNYEICITRDKLDNIKELIIVYEKYNLIKYMKRDYVNPIFNINDKLKVKHTGELHIGLETENQNSLININGSISKPIRIIKENTVLNHLDYTILCDTSEKDIDIILPNDCFGRIYNIKKINKENTVTIISENMIDNEKIYKLIDENKITIQNYANKWFVI